MVAGASDLVGQGGGACGGGGDGSGGAPSLPVPGGLPIPTDPSALCALPVLGPILVGLAGSGC